MLVRQVDLPQVLSGRHVALSEPKLSMRVRIQRDGVRERAAFRRKSEDMI